MYMRINILFCLFVVTRRCDQLLSHVNYFINNNNKINLIKKTKSFVFILKFIIKINVSFLSLFRIYDQAINQ